MPLSRPASLFTANFSAVSSADSSTSPAALAADVRNQFDFLADVFPQLVCITDPTGFHTYFNQRWTDFTGPTLQGSVGPDMWNHLLHPDDQA